MYVEIDGYSRYLLEIKKYSNNTIQAYIRDIKLFEKYLTTIENIDFKAIDNSCILNYIEYLKVNLKAQATINRNIASIKSYYIYMYLRGKIKENPTDNIKLTKKSKTISQTLTKEEINRLLKAPNTTNFKGIRDYAMLELLYATGLRISELINLDTDDISLAAGYILSKGKTDRAIPIHHQAINSLNDYMQNSRQYLVVKSTHALFLNLDGKRISRQGFWKILKKYAIEANIDKDINPFTIRHSFATHLIQNGASLKDVSVMLGHANISTTNIYTNQVNDNIKNTYKKYHPKSK